MVVALVAGALLTVPATAALAAPDVNNVSASPGTVEAGGTVKVSYSLSFAEPIGPADVQVSSSEGKLNCVDGCSRGRVDQNGTFQATFKLADDAADGTATITIKATDSNGPDKQTKEASTQVTLVGKPKPSPTPTQVKTVKSISGKVVVTANGDAVPNATVMLLDSAQHRYQTTSDGSGNFRFVGSSSQPIVPGQIQLGASKETVLGTRSINASAGQSLTGQRISLAIPVEVKPSVSASASASATAAPVPTEEPTEDTATEAPAEAAAPTQQPEAASAEADSGGASWLLILLGGLFVAVGVGTIVLLYMKRKENADDDGDVDGPAGAAAAGAVPAARGAYRGADDQTRVVNRVGAGPDPTMVGGAAMSDAPTMLQRPVVDDVPPDPYGAPPPPAFGAGGAAGQPGGWAGNGYGEEAPGQGGYGGYGNAAPDGGYGNAPASGGGYGAQGGYGNAPASGAGYGNAPASGAGYGNAPASGAGYGNAPASGGGYGAPAGGYGGGQGAGGYGERFDEPTGRYTGEGTQSYTPPADPYPTSTYQPTGDPGHGYGQEPASYGRTGEQGGGYGAGQSGGQGGGYGGYDGGQQSGSGYGGGYDQRGDAYPGQGGGYDQQRGGYDQRGGYGGQSGGYGEAPQQRGGGYDGAAYDQQQGGGYYNEQGQPGRGRADGPPPQQERGGRRLDWLDD
ncbi:Ig-like domain (group 3) [Micromonospora siamensis]|uniref:Ig-like domain (Group 3) n=1 Tax=Micromonospora siamensis TaxID=299152 RepID=A0A1C5GZA7_9ACTN|nr:Ig-like domain (group 3) [Micromonospora siamensis]